MLSNRALELMRRSSEYEMNEHLLNGNYGLYFCSLLDLAKILEENKQLEDALLHYIAAAYFVINGPRNTGNIPSGRMSPFASEDGKFVPSFVYDLGAIAVELNWTKSQLRDTFLELADDRRKRFCLPIAPQAAWNKIAAYMTKHGIRFRR